MSRLVNELIKDGYLKTDPIIEAFSKIRREDFVPEDLESYAEANIPLPIGHGQTISQPLTVAFMLELLSPEKGQNILDVGSGSGWTTALLADIVGEKGKVVALEIVPELCEKGKNNAAKYNFVKKGITEFYSVDGSKGYPEKAPYDRILVSAAAIEIPPALKQQLKVGGRMVMPIGASLWYLEKKSEDDFEREEFPGFSFVPLITNN